MWFFQAMPYFQALTLHPRLASTRPAPCHRWNRTLRTFINSLSQGLASWLFGEAAGTKPPPPNRPAARGSLSSLALSAAGTFARSSGARLALAPWWVTFWKRSSPRLPYPSDRARRSPENRGAFFGLPYLSSFEHSFHGEVPVTARPTYRSLGI
ncbi:hypothetical protein EJ06DRAFT_212524 [Trichodelitschia bisporula]|uniref:Uncharacterized protein n=1 Tax=Trichodelitschia bisporula TaxID=703511 RepID=A0A6G1I8G7_9PEZI|nr:hypothetical protein EJ06DRAFT_212524 [Trichodelitschia bisporula]